MTTTQPATYKLKLPTALGYVYRDSRKQVAEQIKRAAERTGFYYVKNHGIAGSKIDAALSQAKVFFAQTVDEKRAVSYLKSRYFNGWYGKYDQTTLESEGRDNKEGFHWRYDPQYDPEKIDAAGGCVPVPEEVRKWLRGEELLGRTSTASRWQVVASPRRIRRMQGILLHLTFPRVQDLQDRGCLWLTRSWRLLMATVVENWKKKERVWSRN
ncbi:non-hem dioxygenase in morphine synthesis N-terminal-domain-containing protein [Aspergillus stella-maris]|uniref:non-hem dioxygenase in morphine synthesis N-terminal-domain-containing protein n=1 Tax=Aspergillus stella-maris TaxID=1810926 RepID=UPI003CCD95D3